MHFRVGIKFFLAVAWLTVEKASSATTTSSKIAQNISSMTNNYQGLRRKISSSGGSSEKSIATSRNLQAFLPEDMWPEIDFVGDSGNFEVYPLELCMGDCDDDDDCAGILKCFQRDANEAVPGCQGGTTSVSLGWRVPSRFFLLLNIFFHLFEELH